MITKYYENIRKKTLTERFFPRPNRENLSVNVLINTEEKDTTVSENATILF